MNAQEQYMRISKQHLDHSINYRQNVIYLNTHNELSHELAKFLVSWDLIKNGSNIVTEATFKNRLARADIYELETRTAYEILNTETAARFENKTKYYPFDVTLVGLKAEDMIIKHLRDQPWLKTLK